MTRAVVLALAAVAAVAAATTGCARPTTRDPLLAGAFKESAEGDPLSNTAIDRALAENDGGGLVLSEQVKRLCPGLGSPEFGFDSSAVKEQWRSTLQGVARCMITGGLAGRRVIFTGHTDPRGDDDYNMSLGGRRAASVRSAVETFGVPATRLDVTSRGEVDASGTDEKGWQRDRRVDIDVAKG